MSDGRVIARLEEVKAIMDDKLESSAWNSSRNGVSVDGSNEELESS